MIKHYLKVSFRSLLKSRQQTVISIVGLAVGLVCFGLSSLWIWYETSFDTFHPGADRIYKIQNSYQFSETDVSDPSDWTSYPLASYLAEALPEVESSCRVWMYGATSTFHFGENKEVELNAFRVDSGFFKVFGVEPLLKSDASPFETPGNIVVTDRGLAKLPDSGEYTVGSILNESTGRDQEPRQIVSVLKAWPAHTNIPFDVLHPLIDRDKSGWQSSWLHTFVKVREGVDPALFEKKINDLSIPEAPNLRLSVVPLDEVYYKAYLYKNKNVKYEFIPIFSIAGLLVICSALFNFLALFISGLRMKGSELVLRKVNGASDRHLLGLLMTEVAIVLAIVLALSFLTLEWLYPSFESLAVIRLPKSMVLLNVFVCFLLLVVLTLLVSAVPIRYFKSRTLQTALGNSGSARSKHGFLKVSLGVQCMVGIFFVFCASVIVSQLNHYKHADLGFDRENVASVSALYWKPADLELFSVEIGKYPVVERIAVSKSLFLPTASFMTVSLIDKQGEVQRIEGFHIQPQVVSIFGFKVLEGRAPQENESGVLLNEAAIKKLGGSYEIGSVTPYGPVTGIVKNFQYGLPKRGVEPALLINDVEKKESDRIYIKFVPGKKAETEQALVSVLKEKMGHQYYSINFLEDEYDEYFKEERIILGLLSALALVCLLIALFGIYAMVSLVCRQRRREIAIRKINGAGVGTLLRLFAKEYFLVYLVATLLIFPVGYLAMRMWVEQYNEQIAIFPLFLAVAAVVLLLMGCIVVIRVWRTVHLNPSDELKSHNRG